MGLKNIFPLFYGSQKYFGYDLLFFLVNSFSGKFLKILKYINRDGWHHHPPLQTIYMGGWSGNPSLQTISRGGWLHHPPLQTIFRGGSWCHPPLKMLLLYKLEGFRLGHFSRTTKDDAARLPKRTVVLLRPRGRRASPPAPASSSACAASDLSSKFDGSLIWITFRVQFG